MQFIHQGLVWGFLLALLPVLIHLINLMRHRRVKWAAMEFLLQSYRKHRKWIWLRQMLLLLMRMAAVVLAVAMLAQWVTHDQWFALFGGKDTHHYVVLDDSLSMSERQGGSTAFDLALQSVSQIGSRAMQQETRQRFTLLRFSHARSGLALEDGKPTGEPFADLSAEPVGSNFDMVLEELRRGMQATHLALGPLEALNLVKQLALQRSDENRVIYVVSDFRDADWKDPAAIRESLKELAAGGSEIRLISCVRAEQPNLAITRLAAAEDTRAAGVPLFVNVTVKNFGKEAARKVTLKLRATYFDADEASAAAPGKLSGTVDEPPSVLIDEIPAGETVTRRVQVMFPKPGQHVVEAILPEDPIAADNHRWTVIDMRPGEPVLVIDGDPKQRNAYFLSSVFQPGQRAVTGILPDIKPSSFLRDANAEQLARYRAVYLLDVESLDNLAVENLERFVRAGGGLGVFVGEHVIVDLYNERLYRDGKGLMPLPLERDDLLAVDSEQNVPDIEVSDHPIFQPFLGERNPLIRLVSVERFLRPPRDWQPTPESGVAVIARLRNRWPFACERQFGEGRVVIFLTTLSPKWNNWGNDPSFVVALLKLQSHLASAGRSLDERIVGSPLDVQLDKEKFRANITFVSPGPNGQPTSTVDRITKDAANDSQLVIASLGTPQNADELANGTDLSGVYEAWATAHAGSTDIQRFAFNVDSRESNLALSDSQQLLTRLEPVRAQFLRAEELPYESIAQAGYNHSMQILWALVALLVGEQLMAYFTSYHPARGAVR